MKKRGKTFLISLIIFAILGYAGGAALFYFTQDVTPSITDALISIYAFIGIGVGVVLAILFAFLTKPKKEEEKVKTKGKTAGGQEMDLAYDAQWLSVDKLKDQFGLITTNWAQLPSLKNTGIVFRNTIEGGKYQIAMKDEYHCLIIGTTASGKTSLVLVPSIRIYAHSAEKPCMVISDPKGELFTKTSEIMKDEGYRVITLNLRDAFASTRWNPMDHAYEVYHKGKNCRKNIKKCSNGAKPKDAGYREIPGEKYGEEWYGFEGVAYPTQDQVRVAVESAEQVYCDMAFNELREI